MNVLSPLLDDGHSIRVVSSLVHQEYDGVPSNQDALISACEMLAECSLPRRLSERILAPSTMLSICRTRAGTYSVTSAAEIVAFGTKPALSRSFRPMPSGHNVTIAGRSLGLSPNWSILLPCLKSPRLLQWLVSRGLFFRLLALLPDHLCLQPMLTITPITAALLLPHSVGDYSDFIFSFHVVSPSRLFVLAVSTTRLTLTSWSGKHPATGRCRRSLV
jgi:hypothetical protein